jgi:hypothetical protein
VVADVAVPMLFGSDFISTCLANKENDFPRRNLSSSSMVVVARGA